MLAIASLIFALVVWPLMYLWFYRYFSEFGAEFMVAFATIGLLFLLPLYLQLAWIGLILYLASYACFAVLSLVFLIRLLIRRTRSPYWKGALVMLTGGIVLPWVALFLLSGR